MGGGNENCTEENKKIVKNYHPRIFAGFLIRNNATIRKIMCKSFPQTIIILGQQQQKVAGNRNKKRDEPEDL